MKSNTEKKIFLSELSLKKKSVYSKKINNSILKLKTLLNEKQKSKVFVFPRTTQPTTEANSNAIFKKRGSLVVYIISISFSAINTFLHVTDALGNLKFRYSAGLLSFKGKQKRNRFQILNHFFLELMKLKKTRTLKNQPIVLYLNNVKFYKYLIVRQLKKLFFLRFIKSYNIYSYNGCRKKKSLRKR